MLPHSSTKVHLAESKVEEEEEEDGERKKCNVIMVCQFSMCHHFNVHWHILNIVAAPARNSIIMFALRRHTYSAFIFDLFIFIGSDGPPDEWTKKKIVILLFVYL